MRTDESEGAVRVDRFPEPGNAISTIHIMTSNFAGTVRVEATIKLAPQDADWFLVHEEVFPKLTSTDHTRRNVEVNATGRFISMRATATKLTDVLPGIVDRVTVI